MPPEAPAAMLLPGLPRAAIDPALLAATDDLVAAITVVAEIGAPLLEPSHLVVALARVPGSVARSLLDQADIPAEVLVEALRAEAAAGTDGLAVPLMTGRADVRLSPHTEALCAALAAADGKQDERAVLAAAIEHLEPAAKRLLEDFGGVDLAAWVRDAAAVNRPAAPVLGADGRLDPERFTPAARAVLATLRTEADAGGHRRPGTLLLLHAMSSTPRGLIEQAVLFLGVDVRDVRTRTLLLLRRGTQHPGDRSTDVLARGALSDALVAVFERAAERAAERGVALVGERDLLDALLESPAGSADVVLRSAGVDPAALRRFASSLYSEIAETAATGAPAAPAVSVREALDTFQESLIGQPEVTQRLLPVIETIKRAVRRDLRLGERPLATLLFCGPSGTGKTMTARLLAEAIHGSRDALIVSEMGQFNTRESINNFIGAPPGYVGFGEGQLTNGLARTPRCVLLFDEVEKAHKLVLDALLRLLDEGRVNDPAGPVRDARDTVVVLTSNLGAEEFARLTRRRLRRHTPTGPAVLSRAIDSVLGPAAGGVGEEGPARDAGEPDSGPDGGPDGDDVRATLRRALEGFFRPEFLNRIDETLLFAPFGVDELRAIATAALHRRAELVREGLDVELAWDEDAVDEIVRVAARDRADEAARGVNRGVDDVLGLVLRALDEAEDRGAPTRRLRLVVEHRTLRAVTDER